MGSIRPAQPRGVAVAGWVSSSCSGLGGRASSLPRAAAAGTASRGTSASGQDKCSCWSNSRIQEVSPCCHDTWFQVFVLSCWIFLNVFYGTEQSNTLLLTPFQSLCMPRRGEMGCCCIYPSSGLDQQKWELLRKPIILLHSESSTQNVFTWFVG